MIASLGPAPFLSFVNVLLVLTALIAYMRTA
jgi:hypothetical protein